MKIHKKAISIFIAFTLVFSGLPVQFKNFDRAPYVHAGESASIVNIRYEDFSNTEKLQLNGDSLIVNNAIQFESQGGIGESIFIKDKVALGEKLSFSTAFSFRNIHPDGPSGGKQGGFTFTLQSIGNNATSNNFHNEEIQPSLSIAFLLNYHGAIPTARITKPLLLASLEGFKIAQEPPIRCELSTTPYINGDYNNHISTGYIDSYHIGEEASEYYNVWIGYDGEEEILHIVCADSFGNYTYIDNGLNLSEILSSEVFVGFMGSIGDAGNKTEISKWYFRNDLDLIDGASLDADEAWLTEDIVLRGNSSLNNVTSDLYLPTSGEYGSTINWESSNEDVIDINGTVKTPLEEQGDKQVILTANISNGSSIIKTKTFTVTVKVVTDESIVIEDHDWLVESIILNKNTSLDNLIQDLYLPTSGEYGSIINWQSTNIDLIDTSGKVNRPTYTQGDKSVELTATIIMNLVEMKKTFDIKVKALEATDEEILNGDNLWLTDELVLNGNINFDNIIMDLRLPNEGPMGSIISWETSDALVVGTNGKVIRSSYSQGEKAIILTVKLKMGLLEFEKTYNIKVKAFEPSDIEIVNMDYTWLTDQLVLNKNNDFDNIVEDMNLPDKGPMGSIISWASSNPEVVDTTGKVTRPDYTKEYEVVVLTANIKMGSKENERIFIVKVIALEPTDEDIVNVDNLWLTESKILNINTSLDNIIGNIELPNKGPMGSNISWTTSNSEIVSIGGTVNRPTYTKGDKSIVLTAKVSMGLRNIEKIFNIIVKALDETDEEKVNADKEWLTDLEILKDNTSLDNIIGDLTFPTIGLNGSTISWTSNNVAVIATDGTVTRPYTSGDKIVVLTATIGIGEVTETKAFTLTVIKIDKTNAEKVADDEIWLTNTLILNGNSSLDNVTENLNLSIEGENGSIINWTSDNEDIITIDGIVKRSSYTIGDKEIVLTATIINGEFTATKKFIVKVIKLEQTEEESNIVKMNNDYEWLTDLLLKGNNADLDHITVDLTLTNIGQYGSTISWTSSNGDVIKVNNSVGKVYRPKYDLPAETVTLIANITMGTFTREKIFSVTVLPRDYMFDNEVVESDLEWLTEELILNGNSSLDNVITNLYLPTKGVGYEPNPTNVSTIEWWISNPSVIFHIGDSGNIFRPSIGEGNKPVNITATLRCGPFFKQKTFKLLVRAPELTDEEAVSQTKKWLKTYKTVPYNNTSNVVTKDLSWPKEGLNGATVTWTSDKPDVISSEGLVTRPAYDKNHVKVNATATIRKGEIVEVLDFEYTVLREPDTVPPVVVYTSIDDNTGLSWDTSEFTIRYDKNIVLNPDIKITLNGDMVRVSTIGNTLNIKPIALPKPFKTFISGENKLIIPAGVITNKNGSPSDAFELKFTMKEIPVRNIEVISSYPNDTEKDISTSIREVTIQFNANDIVKGNDFDNNIVLSTLDRGYKEISTNNYLVAGKVTMQLKDPLTPGTIYGISIDRGAVRDESYNINNSTYIKFKTQDVLIHKIESIYPAKGERNVSVNPNIEIMFSNLYKPKSYDIKLTDEFGNDCPLYAPYTLDVHKAATPQTMMIFKPKKDLQPNMVYTLSGPYGWFEDSDEGKEFSIEFTTGSGPKIIRTSPSTGDLNASRRGRIEIHFDTPVTKGPNFDDIVFENIWGYSVGFNAEEEDSKATLLATDELEALPHTIYIPYGAYKDSNGVLNTQNKITYDAKLGKNMGFESYYLDVPEVGFIGKMLKIGVHEYGQIWEDYLKSDGYGPLNYEWSIDGELVSKHKYFYHVFYNLGEHQVTLTVKDKYGFTYSGEKNVEVKALSDVEMSLKRNQETRFVGSNLYDGDFTLNCELRLESEGQFIADEKIEARLYRDGVLQPLGQYTNGAVYITSTFEEGAYRYLYKADRGDFGTYEFEFTYGDQVIRQTFMVFAEKPNTTDVFRFRLYERIGGDYYEDLNYVYVNLNGERIKANKEMYTYDGSTYPVYVIIKPLQTNVYYHFNVENWWGDYGENADKKPFYIGKDTNNPTILTGGRGGLGHDMRISHLKFNSDESDLRTVCLSYFEGLSTKMVLNVEGDWAGTDTGYYEIKTSNISSNLNLISPYNNRREIQEIIVQPGIQLKADPSDHYLIRMVSAQGFKSPWYVQSSSLQIDVLPIPSIMGKKLEISIKDKEYVIAWPTVFDGPIGGAIGFLEGIPVVSGGSFGMGGSMPKFEGEMHRYGNKLNLSFAAKAGYGTSSTTSQATKYKKLKKVTVVGVDFHIELDGDITLVSDRNTGEWGIAYFRISLGGDVRKYWDKGYKFLGVGFTAGIGLGGGVYGTLIVEDGDKYSGIIKIIPHADLHVDGSFVVASVKGSLTAKIPAEIHFPTGYIGVGFEVDAYIYAKALLWGKVIYEKKLVNLQWDNGKQKVIGRSMGMLMEEALTYEDSGMQLMSRDYLNRESNWLDESTSSMDFQETNNLQRFSLLTTEAEANISIMDMLENIFPEADIELITNQGDQWLVWTDDNPSRDDINRTQLRYFVLKDGSWSNAEWICDDETADFTPVVAPVGNGILMAWHNIGKKLTGEEGLDDALKSSEIYVTEGIFTDDGEEPKTIRLTDDDKIDHSPKIASDGDKALLVWTKSEELGFGLDDGDESSSSSKGQLYFSTWYNDTWATPTAISIEASTILDLSLTMNGEEGLLLYTVDMDDNLSTGEDREIYARSYDGNSWGEAIKLTDNLCSDSSPKAVHISGEWFITWLEDGKILYKIGLDGETKTEEMLENIQGNYQITVKDGDRPLIALIYTQPGEDKALDLYTSFYDFDNRKWSGKVDLVTDNNYTGDISCNFDQEGKLNVAFTQAEIITELGLETIDGIEEIVETTVVTDKVDLKLLTYTPIHDVAILEEGINLSREIPIPNAVTTVYATLANEGDFAENIRVYLYDGDPNAMGVNIAETDILSLPGRTSKEIQIDWLVGEERDQYDLYLVAEIIDEVQERNLFNNTFDLYTNINKAVGISVSTLDIAITDLTCENIAADDYFINLTINNNGFNDLEGATLWLEDDTTGEVLQTTSLARLGIGEQTTLTYMISSMVEKNLRARVSLPEGVNESNTENNIEYFTLGPAPFMLKNLNIGPGEEQVDLGTELIIEFNMSVGKGSGFNNIKLMDDDFNVLNINKIIEDNILTIKPQDLLDHKTHYKLVIPADALGDSYGHSLKREFNMNFTTMTTNPEIVSAYPGNGMKAALINTDIKLRFNQNIIKVNEFAKLSLYEHGDESGTKNIPVSASIEGEMLNIIYQGKLNNNTLYTLEIPRGSVTNHSGETQGEDYILVFTTGDEEKEENKEENKEDSTAQPPSYSNKAKVSFGKMEKMVEIQTQNGKAIIKLDTVASEVFKEKQNVVLNIPTILGIDSYMLEIPAKVLVSGEFSLTINTALGSLNIPFNMLSKMDGIKDKTIGIIIGAADKSKLPVDVRTAIGEKPVLEITLTLDGKDINWSNEEAPVGVLMPYRAKGEELKHMESIITWYIDLDGNIIIIPNGYYNHETDSVNFSTTHFSNFAVAYNNVGFKDVKAGAWYEEAVSFIAAREITTGTGNGKFEPNNKLTRGQFIAMMMRAYSIEPSINQEDNFSDAGNTWYTGYLATAKQLGISKGVGNNIFAPDNKITRQEMFTLIYNTLKLINQLPERKESDIKNHIKTISDFTDKGQIASWAKEEMNSLVESGTIIGSSGKLKPLNIATRAEMAQILYNLMTR